MQPIGIIYKIYSLITDEVYIGSAKFHKNPTKSLKYRMYKHKDLENNKCRSRKIIEYGEGNYDTEIIEVVEYRAYELMKIGEQEPKEFLLMREQNNIDYYKNIDNVINGNAAWVSEEDKLEKKKNNAVIYANTYNQPKYQRKEKCVCGGTIIMNRPYEHMGKKNHINCMKNDDNKKEFMEKFQGPVFGNRKNKDTIFDNAEKDSYPLLLEGAFLKNKTFTASEENELTKMRLRIQNALLEDN